MFYQNDTRWKFEVMTKPPYPNGYEQDFPDTIGMLGCYVTSLTNAVNNLYNAFWTPSEVNALLKKNNGYKILKLKEKCQHGQESYLVEEVFEKIFNVKITRKAMYVCSSNQYVKDENKVEYILKFNFKGYAHFSNIIELVNGAFKIYNVWNGQYEICNNWLEIIKVERNAV